MKTKRNPIDAQSAKAALRDFYLAARKEIMKHEEISANIGATSEMANLHFVCDGFDLHFILKATKQKGGIR